MELVDLTGVSFLILAVYRTTIPWISRSCGAAPPRLFARAHPMATRDTRGQCVAPWGSCHHDGRSRHVEIGGSCRSGGHRDHSVTMRHGSYRGGIARTATAAAMAGARSASHRPPIRAHSLTRAVQRPTRWRSRAGACLLPDLLLDWA